MSLHDYKLALLLQKKYDEEENKKRTARNDFEIIKNSNPKSNFSRAKPMALSKTSSLVDRTLEYTDPNPDIHALFLHFNDVYFWGKLLAVEVRWSPRMTSCAGICCYEGRGRLCSIRLSLPLLKLRPRKDLVETLLHEMIHAFLFVTNNNRDRDGHGPEFHKHMHRINQSAGTKITVYHSFHDEVRSYQQHWWQCQGPCRNRKPYFGMVRRAMNRAPGPSDFWWAEHQATCGGTYIKIREPEGYGAAKKGKSTSKAKQKGKSQNPVPNSFPAPENKKSIQGSSNPGIPKYFSPNKQDSFSEGKNDSQKGKAPSKTQSPHTTLPKYSITKKDSIAGGGKSPQKKNLPSKTPSPHTTLPKYFIPKKQEGFAGGEKSPQKKNLPSKSPSPHTTLPKYFIPKKQEGVAGGERSPKKDKGPLLSTAKSFVPFSGEGRVLGSGTPKLSAGEPSIKRPKMSFPSSGDSSSSEKVGKSGPEVKCPVCGLHQPEARINEHLDECILRENSPSCSSTKNEQWQVECPGCRVKMNEDAFDDHLEECEAVRGTPAPPEEVYLSSDEDGSLENKEETRECVCPACGKATAAHLIAQHLDTCLLSMSFDEDME